MRRRRNRSNVDLKDQLVTLIKTDTEFKAIVEGLFANMAGDYDPDMDLTATQGGSLYFRKLTQAVSRDLNSVTQSRSIEIAAWLYDTNPLAKRIVELVRDYILGEGATVSVQDADEHQRQRQQEIIDGFWNDPFNNFDMMLLNYVLEMNLFGELLLPVSANPIDGHTRISYVDAGLIDQVYVDINNTARPTQVITGNMLSTQAVLSTEKERYKVISFQDDPNLPWYGRLIQVPRDNQGNVLETYQDRDPKTGNLIGSPKPFLSSCFLFQINKPISGRRGRSDLLALADWVDSYDQILFGEIDRNLLMRSFIWDVTIDDADDKKIADYQKRNSAPKPGTVRFHNDKVHWDAVSPNLNSLDVTQSLDAILSYIATGAGLPKTWLNGLTDVNRSTASELGEPAFKRLSQRQKYVRYMITNILTFVLDQAEITGFLDKRPNMENSLLPVPWRFSIHLPEIRARDLSTNSNALLATAQSLAIMREDLAIDTFTEQDVIKILLDQLGTDIDLIALRERMEKNPTVPPVRSQPMSAQVSNSRTKVKSPEDSKRTNGKVHG